MLARVITLGFDALTRRFDDEPLRDFVKDKKILQMNEHFFQKDGEPYLAIFIAFENSPMALPEKAKKKDDSWRELIKDEDLPLFNALRDWRKMRSDQEGYPPYLICTNKILAAVLDKRPQTLEELGQIEGFGKVKLEKYGKDILKFLAPGDAS